MIEETVLLELKLKLPKRYVPAVQKAYKELFNEEISRWTIMRFLKGDTYTENVHNAIISVVSSQQLLYTKTDELING